MDKSEIEQSMYELYKQFSITYNGACKDGAIALRKQLEIVDILDRLKPLVKKGNLAEMVCKMLESLLIGEEG